MSSLPMPGPPTPQSTHFDSGGNARMVDITSKSATVRTAIAEGLVRMRAETAAMIRGGTAAKGDVLGIARIAAIQATKLTPTLIPLCHAIGVEAVDVRFEFSEDPVAGSTPGTPPVNASAVTLRCEAEVRTSGKTGVEMEALTAVSVGCLAIYDMCKSVDRGMEIVKVRLLRKTGGASGDFVASGERSDNG
jgi:cyclic pyranopterin monophosphate synthase